MYGKEVEEKTCCLYVGTYTRPIAARHKTPYLSSPFPPFSLTHTHAHTHLLSFVCVFFSLSLSYALIHTVTIIGAKPKQNSGLLEHHRLKRPSFLHTAQHVARLPQERLTFLLTRPPPNADIWSARAPPPQVPLLRAREPQGRGPRRRGQGTCCERSGVYACCVWYRGP